MTTYWQLPKSPLQELAVGKWVTVNGDRRRVVALDIRPAAEDDAELGVKAGDMVTTVTFGEPDNRMYPHIPDPRAGAVTAPTDQGSQP